MKKKYQTPVAETVNVRLLSSVLDDAPIVTDSEESLEWGGKKNDESPSDWEEEDTPSYPGNINLWDD